MSMTCYQEIICPNCGSNHIIKAGTSAKGIQRYRCQNQDCTTKSFMQKYAYKAYEQGVKKQVVEMAINGSGIRDTARVLKISKNTVIATLKKKKRRLST
ncbi:MAG: InsA-like protein [uncultured Thiotrichaceae bacterium]|uniref:InsA-like protein n=1 Tax=uncultured Thiotrichaceae bacterium TaxID=298394 RepID=A0A6S6SLD7_9GAMM|nr:MAG: InsA-like protein [uncultured Thiotrichaceae bacterium]CAA6827825.1 MAG: InsA-like protein [uncultured Thiotrichaceae bacterium]